MTAPIHIPCNSWIHLSNRDIPLKSLGTPLYSKTQILTSLVVWYSVWVLEESTVSQLYSLPVPKKQKTKQNKTKQKPKKKTKNKKQQQQKKTQQQPPVSVNNSVHSD